MNMKINTLKYSIRNNPKIYITIIGAIYLSPSLFLYFVSEDLNFAMQFKDLTFFTALKNVWIPTTEFIHNSGLSRPIVSSINLLDYELWGLNPIGYHITNAIFHLINIILVFIFSLQIFNKRNLALICSLIFLFHPIIGSSVYWISGRTDIIACMFYLFSAIQLNKFILHNNYKFLILSSFSFFAALLSKEISITIPLIHIWQIIYYVYIQNRSFNFNNLIKRVIIADLLIISIFFIYRFFVFGANLFVINDIYNIDSFYHLFINIIKIFSFLVVPFGHEYFELFVYQYKMGLVWLIIPSFLVFIYLLIKKRNIKPIEKFLLLLIILVSLPLFKLTMRWYMYIPTIPFAMLLSYITYSRWNNSNYFRLIIVIYFISIGYGSIKQYKIWYNNSQLNSRMVNQLVSKISLENEIDTFVILNFPTKVNRTSTFVAGFEELVQLHINDVGKTIIRLGEVVHQYNIQPVNIRFDTKRIKLSILSDDSYFLLGSNKQVLGLENLASEDIITSDICDIKVEKVNELGKVIEITVIMNNSINYEKTMFLQFNENLLTYDVIQ